MKHLKNPFLPCILAIVLSASLMSSEAAGAASGAICGAWSLVSSPNVGLSDNRLAGVTAITTRDVWAVGSSRSNQALIEQWKGKKWHIISSPSAGSSEEIGLLDVAAVAINDIWAVGYRNLGDASLPPLIEHWDGSQWSIVSSPNLGSIFSLLKRVAAISSNDIWAVGSYSHDFNSSSQTLIEHWDGSQWSLVSSPNVGSGSNNLNGVAALSATNVWAAGTYYNGSNIEQTLIEHWDGSQWSVIPSPNVGSNGNSLSEVAALSTNNIWAVGSSSSSNNSQQTLIEHWDGSQWSVIPSPNVGSGSNYLSGVAAITRRNIWAVGSYYNSSTASYQTLIEHWDGSQWSVVPSPNPGSANNNLNAVARVPGTKQLWTVGSTYGNQPGQTITELYCP